MEDALDHMRVATVMAWICTQFVKRAWVVPVQSCVGALRVYVVSVLDTLRAAADTMPLSVYLETVLKPGVVARKAGISQSGVALRERESRLIAWTYEHAIADASFYVEDAAIQYAMKVLRVEIDDVNAHELLLELVQELVHMPCFREALMVDVVWVATQTIDMVESFINMHGVDDCNT